MYNSHDYLKKISAWLVPYTCLFCQHASDQPINLCKTCKQSLPFISPLPHPASVSMITSQSFNVFYALFHYTPLVRQLILQIKFKHNLIIAHLLGELIAQQIHQVWYANNPLPDVIIPMPLHSNRLKERGFNQAIELAKPISRLIQRPLAIDIIERRKDTLAQATLKAIDRQKNLANAFSIAKNLNYQHIAIVDDVFTTGTTLTELCSTIRQKYAIKIDVWCIAQALLA